MLLHTATIQICRVTRSLPFSDDAEREAWLASIRDMEINAAKSSVTALRVFGEEVRKLSTRMQGNQTGLSVRTVAEVQEHPCLLLSVSLFHPHFEYGGRD